jgi:hypothetical protein
VDRVEILLDRFVEEPRSETLRRHHLVTRGYIGLRLVAG